MFWSSFWCFVIKYTIRSGLRVTVNAVLCHYKLSSPTKSRLISFFLTGGLLFQRPWTLGWYWKGFDMSKGSIFSWNKAPQSLYSLWYSALKMQTKARQGKANQSHPRHRSPGAENFPAAPALTSQWYSSRSVGNARDHSPSESVLLGRWVMPTARCTACSLQSAEPVCEASSPWTKEARRWLHGWARLVKTCRAGPSRCVRFIVCESSFSKCSKRRQRKTETPAMALLS